MMQTTKNVRIVQNASSSQGDRIVTIADGNQLFGTRSQSQDPNWERGIPEIESTANEENVSLLINYLLCLVF